MSAALVLRWSFGNAKLKRTRTVSFNLPAHRSADGFRVCPGSAHCVADCYARQGRYQLPEVIRAREINLSIVRASLPLFEQLAISDLERIRQKIVRVHDSGDFYSQEYLDCWFRIMRVFPARRFYAYTKSLHLDWTAIPPNFRRVQSTGGRFDALIDRAQSHTRVFVTHHERQAAGYIDGNRTDRPAMNGEIRIGFVYHGSRPISAAFARYLRQEPAK